MSSIVHFTLDTVAASGGISSFTATGVALDAWLARCFRPAHVRRRSSGTLVFGHLLDDGVVIDEALCAWIPEEESLTGAPTVRLTCHGGSAAVAAAVRAMRRAGARRVDSPFFWRTAYRARRRDRLRVEAAIAFPRAATPLAAAVFLAQREGAAARAIDDIRIDLARDGIAAAERRLLDWRSTLPLGFACLDPIRVAIVGAPNTGKSTLFNALVGRERAVVHAEAGTTRDAVEELGAIDGVPVRWIDIAGFGPPRDPLDAAAQSAGEAHLRSADLRIVVVESTRLSVDAEDPWTAVLRRIGGSDDVPWIPVVSKGDLAGDSPTIGKLFSAASVSERPGPLPYGRGTAMRHSASLRGARRIVPSPPTGERGEAGLSVPIRVTAPDGTGLDDLRRAVLVSAGIGDADGIRISPPEAPVCWSLRQAAALDNSLKAIRRAATMRDSGRARTAVQRAIDVLDRRLRWGR